jgi:hypothetical protein
MMTTRDAGPHAYYDPHEFVDDAGTAQCFVCNLTEAEGNHIVEGLSADVTVWAMRRRAELLEKRKLPVGALGCAYCHKPTRREWELYCSERCSVLHAHERRSRQPKPIASALSRRSGREAGCVNPRCNKPAPFWTNRQFAPYCCVLCQRSAAGQLERR